MSNEKLIIELLHQIKKEIQLMGQGLQNLNAAITALQAQVALTVTAIQNLQSSTGDSDSAVQSAATAVTAATAALANATPAPITTPAA